MATPLELADRRYRAGVALRRTTDKAAASLWRRMDVHDLDRSWLGIGPLVVSLVTAAQERAASGADDYVDGVLDSEDIDNDAAGRLVPSAFAGIASDGRPLDSLLYSPVTTVKSALASGATDREALTSGLFALQLITGTQVADAGRVADGVATTARPKVGGYVRMLSLPSCARCAILAGKFYRWNAGFARHPRCDCRHIPASENLSGDLTTNPMEAFRAGQVKGLTDGQRKAIEDGADISQVVNARRKGSVYTAGGHEFTREGATSRGFAGHRLGELQKQRGEKYRRSRIGRLTPEQIYRDANGDRDEAIRLLRRFGYII